MNLKKTFAVAALSLLLGTGAACIGTEVIDADAAVNPEPTETAEPYGLFVNMSIGLTNEGATIIAVAKNEFTLLPSTVEVIVELYSSESYQTTYLNMTLENRAYIADLDQGQSLSTSASTNGQQRWWIARTSYKRDASAWKELVTTACLYDGDGNFISK